MGLTIEEHLAAAREALEREPWRYWTSGYNVSGVRHLRKLLETEQPDRTFELREFGPTSDECVIIDLNRSDLVGLDEIRAVAEQRARLRAQGHTNGLPE